MPCTATFALMDETRTEIGELGEFGLINKLTEGIIRINDETVLGIGDDAAVIDAKGKQTVVTTDLLTEGVHFNLMYTPLRHLGYKAVIVNLSDVLAMNALPSQVTVSLAVSNRFSVEALEELYEGVKLACRMYNVDLIGGDLTSSVGGLMIAVTALGFVEAERVVLRSTAKKGDLLVVTGDLGGAYMGLQILEREKEVFKEAPGAQPELEGVEYILERQLKPEARKDVIEHLREIKIQPTAMIDISDGLASEALHLATESKLGVRIYEDKLPIDQQTYDQAREFNLDPSLCALNGGEDYELLFTIDQSDFEKIKGDPHFSVIGYMAEQSEGCELIFRNGGSTELTAQGWDAFRKES